MSKAGRALGWVPFNTLFYREVRRFLKVSGQTVLTPLMNSSLYLLIFGVSLGSQIQLSMDISYLGFLIPGLVMMSCLNNAFQNSASSVINGKFSGDIEDWKVAPLANWELIWAIGLGGVVRGFTVGFVTWGVGQVFFYIYEGQWLGVEHTLWLFFFLTVGAASFSFIGLSAAFWSKNFDQIGALGGFVLLPLIYLGGVFFSLENLNPFWQKVASLNPLLYYINGVRYGMLGISDVDVINAAVISAASLLFFFGVSVWSLKKGTFSRW
jgi:ABC-2 type transport system permease protein